MSLTREHFHSDFKWQITAQPGGERLQQCFDCGSCTGVCPVSESGTGFDPRKILHMVRMGLKDQLLGSPEIWHCTHCETCAFVCPQDVQFSDVVNVLRRLALAEGYADRNALEIRGTAPCKAACPAHISICGFISAISQGDYHEGLRLIKKDMPFPAICGRVCPHPCEEHCSRGSLDDPLSIMSLKRFLADNDLASERGFLPRIKERKNKAVAVVGSGPAGLSAAYYLAIEGYPVTVFEKLPVAGGMMAVGIPEYRLPRDVLKGEIDVIKRLGVQIRLNCEIGRDLQLVQLREEFDALFMALGCHRGVKLRIPGEEGLDGVVDGISFLRDVHLGRPPSPRQRLVVIGGGNAAVDCARTAKRLGYEEVSILYRRSREEMPAYPWEVEEAMEEGIDIQFLTAPLKILAEKGKVSALQCIRMTLGPPDGSGRRRPLPLKGSEFQVSTDVVVPAIGQHPDLGCLSSDLGVRVSQRSLIEADLLTCATASTGIFAGGDVVSGPSTVVEAVAFGKKAARAIDHYLRGAGADALMPHAWTGYPFTPESAETKGRETLRPLSLAERKRNFNEIHAGFDEAQARREAGRCFKICGLQKAG